MLKQVESGVYKSGDKIPTELGLCALYNISRPTVRQALNELVQEGYLVKKRRFGTFVSQKVFTQNAVIFSTFAEEIAEIGLKHSAKLIKKETIEATEELADMLNVQPGDPLFSIVRLRLANDEPLVIRHSIIPCYLDSQLFKEDLEQIILYEHFAEKGYHPHHSKQTFRAVKASKQEAKLLNVPVSEPLMSWDGIVYLEGDIPLEKVNVLYIGSRFSFEVDQMMKGTKVVQVRENRSFPKQ
jgi:GntR family transcriptional regulator